MSIENKPMALVLADELSLYAAGDEFQRATEGAAEELRRLRGVELEHARLLEKHNALHANYRACRDERDALATEVERLRAPITRGTWTFERKGDRLCVWKEDVGGYAAKLDDTNIASTMLYHLAVEFERLHGAAQAVLDRWDSPQWKWAQQGPTADLMTALRAAVGGQDAAVRDEPVWESKAGGLKPLSQRRYELQPDKIKAHYTRIQPAAARVPLTGADAIRNACPRGYNRCGHDGKVGACVAEGCPAASQEGGEA